MEPSREFKVKVCLLGDGAVGKTSLIRKFVYDEFDDKYIMTLGAKTSKKVVSLPNPKDRSPVDITLMISDVMGQTDVGSIHDAYLFGTKGAIIVCDFTRRSTLENIKNWMERLRKVCGEVPVVFVVNKYDLIFDAQFDFRSLQKVADEYRSPAVVASAKTGENVEKVFHSMAERLMLLRV
jgi:small GTP-binding protein